MNHLNNMGALNRLPAVVMLLTVTLSSPAFAQNDDNLGKETYDLWCGICHDAGEGFAGTQMLALTRAEGLSVMKDNDTLVAPYIELVVRKGLGMMPVFRKTEITDEQLEALIEYIGSDE